MSHPLPSGQNCPFCNGGGRVIKHCEFCNASGVILIPVTDIVPDAVRVACDKCKGTGRREDGCITCRGSGQIHEDKRY